MLLTAGTLSGMPRKPLSDSEKKVPLNSRVSPALFAAMQALADADDRTLSYMAEKAMREYVERHGKPSPSPKKK